MAQCHTETLLAARRGDKGDFHAATGFNGHEFRQKDGRESGYAAILFQGCLLSHPAKSGGNGRISMGNFFLMAALAVLAGLIGPHDC
ncbi:hypothetical protein [Nitrosomonas sp.]|uniref:hypothetical protein n=1 Tax=Nitrosomonas sp. TaxID=42353 RepID=UPI0025F01240|nr:hypothetical protein [Nitrosomonas sp.]MCC6916508.1 hypothetical protein [Nitrosomonas sp.]